MDGAGAIGLGGMMAAHGGPAAPATRQSNDALARSRGFKDAATMLAYYQKQQQMRTGPAPGGGSGGLLQQLFAIHPSVMLNHVLDRWNQADGSGQ